jgi:cysteine-rich repeat protein
MRHNQLNMKRRIRRLHKVFSLISGISLIVNSILPASLLPLLVTPAYAQEETPTPEPTITETPTPTEEPTVVPTPVITETPTEAPSPTEEATPSPTPEELTPTPTEVAQPTETGPPLPTEASAQEGAEQGQILDGASTVAPTPTETVTVETTPTPEPTGHIEAAILKNASALSLDLSSTDISGSAVLTTNKPDYAPTDTVVIAGTGFTAGETYTLIITSQDPPAVTHEAQVTANANGDFIYSYQLDSTYRPNYLVEVKDIDTTIATTTFTDGQPIPTPSPSFSAATTTIACMGDQPSAPQQLNCTANDISIANVSGITINGHGCRFPGDVINFTADWQIRSTATQRYNVGLWFASQGQSDALHGTCSASTLASSPSPFFEATNDSCGDIQSNGIGTVSITMTATCIAASGTNTLQLPYCTSWDQNEKENNACSSPSDTVPGAPSKCSCNSGFTVPIIVPFGAHIEVVKHLTPTNDPGKFNLQIDGTTQASSACVGDTGTTGSQEVGAGTSENPGATHTVGETACTDPATNLADYTSSISCVKRGTSTVVASGSGVGPLDVPVQKDDDIVCTITNSLKATCGDGVVNQTSEQCDNGTQNGIACTPPYGTNGQPASCNYCSTTCQTVTLTDGYCGDNIINGSEECDGTTGVTEHHRCTASCTLEYVPYCGDGLVNQTSEQCDDGNTNDADACSNSCTLNKGNIIVKKVMVGGTDSFTFTGDVAGTVNTNNETITVNDVLPGTYSSTESAKSGWDLNNITCNDPTSGTASNGNTSTRTATFNVEPNETVTCTFTNSKLPTLTLTKTVVNDNGGTATLANFQAKINSNNVPWSVTQTLTPGNYTASETTLATYQPSAWGTDCNSDGTVSLSYGDNKTCTITNDDIAPQLTVIKHVITDNGGEALAGDFQMNVTGTNVSNPSFAGAENPGTTVTLDAGSYSVDEDAFEGYTKTLGANCSGTIAVGDTKTCTITNDDIQPKLTVTKVVVGSDKPNSEFQLYVDDTPVTSGVQNGFNAGSYNVNEDNDPDFTISFSGDCDERGDITLNNGDVKSCTITNTRDTGTLRILKNVDLNGDGDYTDQGETGATDWLWQVYGPVNQSGNTGDSAITVPTGNYILAETQKPGFHLESLSCSGGTLTLFTVAVTNGANVVCTFRNKRDIGTITVDKITDPSGASEQFTINLNQGETIPQSILIHASTLADQDNPDTYIVPTGNFYWFEELQKAGWSLTDATCTDGEQSFDATANSFNVTKDVHLTCTFTNTLQNPILTITKENNTGGANKSPSDSVLFTITVTATQSAAYNVHVTDLPAGGFVPRDGTYTANSSVRGDIFALTGNPGYHSPGVWNLGNMIVGEKVTLTYLADIAGNEQPGLYYDLAWAAGCKTDSGCSDVLANAVTPGYIADNYVGTEVRILTDQQYGANVNVVGEVLGASTELPATGANIFWLYIAFALITGGITLGALGWFLRRKYA